MLVHLLFEYSKTFSIVVMDTIKYILSFSKQEVCRFDCPVKTGLIYKNVYLNMNKSITLIF